MQKDEIIKLINTYWKFDNDQDTTSTWHDKQDLINEIEQLTIPDVVSTSCDKCDNTGILWSKDRLSAKTCGCK